MKRDFIIMPDGRWAMRERCGGGEILYPISSGSEAGEDSSGSALGHDEGSRAVRIAHRLLRALRRPLGDLAGPVKVQPK
jgi:hypothetical protein